MPKFRDVYIEKEKTLADSGTEIIELALSDPISELQIRFKIKNGGTSNINNPVARNITKIELVDGANVIYSLDGMLSQAMSYYSSGILPSMQRQSGPSENQEDHFILRFGRHLWDAENALVPAKFRNLQLKISYNLANVTALGATGFLTGSAKLTVITRIMEDLGAEPAAYMMAKSHYNWTTAASGEERISLPTDHTYAMLLFRAWETEVKLYSTISNLKLSIDQDKDVPFDLDSWDFLKMMENRWGLFDLDQHVFATSVENIQSWLGVGETAVATPESASGDPTAFRSHIQVYGVDSGHVNFTSDGSDHSTNSQDIVQLKVSGQALHHCYAYPFGRMEDVETYFNAPEVGDIKFIATQGNAGADGTVALLQRRLYI